MRIQFSVSVNAKICTTPSVVLKSFFTELAKCLKDSVAFRMSVA